ncbi:hypothetical protein ABMA27_014471 [Loxostege sticticalis]|uniref:Uncharacterized protein n=1 Tax=Loxostege sticticalis TaxID=481309 RepID=A0ABR3I939_LOXSC
MAATKCLCVRLMLLAVVGYGPVSSEIRKSVVLNKLVKVKPVGGNVAKTFVPLTEIPPPHLPHVNGRRHFEDCSQKPPAKDVFGGAKVDIFGEYYDDRWAKTVATIIFPDHIDRKFFEVTTQVPYLTVGPIEAIGYHPSTLKSEHPAECEKIYQDHLAEQYSDENAEYSEESLEMARMPLGPDVKAPPSSELRLEGEDGEII